MRILIPDFFCADAEVEKAVAGGDLEIDYHRWRVEGDNTIAKERWAAADALVMYEAFRVDEEKMSWMKKCRLVVRAGVGYDNVDIKAWGARGIPVCNVPDYGTMDVAEHAVGLVLAITRGIVPHDRNLRRDPVREWTFDKPKQIRRLLGQKVGIIGLGRIGTAFAQRIRGFGVDVWFYDPYRPTGTELALGIGRAESLEELIAGSDIVSLHTPLTDETRGMIDRKALSHAKPNLIFITTARGECTNLDDIYQALRDNVIEAAGLDVLWREPPDPNHPLVKAWTAAEPWIEDRLVMTPHSAFYSPSSMLNLRRKGIEVVLSYLKHGRLKNCVNEQYLVKK